MITADSLPDDVATLKALVLAGQAALTEATAAQLAAEAKARNLEAEVRSRTLLIEQMKFTIATLKHEQFGPSSERASVLEQLELELADLEEDAAEAEAAAQMAAERAKAEKIDVRPFERRQRARRPLPEHLPRERIVHPAPAHCPCCGGDRLRKIGEDVTETLELVPRQWKVIQHVREKFSCRACEAITQPPAPFHPISRGRAGPRLLAHILFAKYGLHLPLNRQGTTYAHEGVALDVSTLADWVGAAAGTLMPLVEAIKTHVLAGERLHADDTTVPVLAKGKTRTGRVWTYVRDDRPFAGHAPPAALFLYSPDRSGAHPETHLAGYAGPMQADAYAGFNRLYEASRKPGPIIEVGCWAHARRKFFEIARLKKAPIAIEAIAKIDALFAIEREINGLPAHERKAVRDARSRPLVDELHAFLRDRRAKLSGKSETAKAIDYSLKRWQVFTRFIDDGRLCMTNNAAERELRAVAVGRKNWTFAGSDDGGRRAAAIYTLIQTAKLNDLDPLAWLTDVLLRINDHPASRLDELLPWNWSKPRTLVAAARSDEDHV
ncbi:IS66 family transposase [Bradyrhizobium oligotrophicum]|uniref:IS66 family transposase n=1 Tax=Bradyrhizobium oligotrophicum TaxID=44255 RepID=UPI003EB8BC7F